MRESAFIQRNRARWEEFEKYVNQPSAISPDKLAELFIQVTDDLAFSRTQYPHSRTTQYLNALATRVQLEIYKNKKEDTNRFVDFWKLEVPEVVAGAYKPILYAFLIFSVAAVIGSVSAAFDDTFVRLILGDGYVNMTLENIRTGNPTRVYESHDELTLFFFIAWNNVMVSFQAFIFGIFFSLGTGFFLFQNGLMIGAFMTFFYRENQLTQALPVIMLHGTIELTSIVLAGAAGFLLGNSLLFPGTYSRLASFRMGALKGVKIVMGLVPFFLVAAFIEGFITRHAFMHWSLKALVIAVSATLMLYYFFIYPKQLRHGKL